MKASAFVVGPQNGEAATLASLAREAGFGQVLPYTGLAQAEALIVETPLVFFLCLGVQNVKTLKPMADAIRFSASRKVRFSPVIYFARNPSAETIQRCINMGFDDVVALPCSPKALTERMGRQVGELCVYYETSNYFGPDRRERIELDIDDPRRGNGSQFRRLEIRRSTESGIDVVSDELQVQL